MSLAVTVLLLLLASPLLLATGYLLLLTLCSARPRAPLPATPRLRFCVVIPAHDEEAGIAGTVANALALQWPAAQLRVWVIADNCSDDTAARARAAGARVLERRDPLRRGKGYALDLAFRSLLDEGWADVVLVLDADSRLSRGAVAALASRFEGGALAAQLFYGVLNPRVNWRTRLLAIALALFHRLRGRGRERLRLSCGLRGNGMAFAAAALRRVPHRSYSIVEDVEYGLELGRAGIRVHYVDEDEVLSDMEASERNARSQRQRWETGRRLLACQHGAPLLREALRRRDAVLLDLALDVLLPPLSTVGLASAALALAGIAASLLGLVPAWLVPVCGLPALLLVVHVLRGVALSGLGALGWVTLLSAPAYVGWKLSLRLRGRSDGKTWVRTTRADADGNPPRDP